MEIVERRMDGLQMNNELEIIWKEAAVALCKYYPRCHLERLREAP
jgi:predicted RecB family nuclease